MRDKRWLGVMLALMVLLLACDDGPQETENASIAQGCAAGNPINPRLALVLYREHNLNYSRGISYETAYLCTEKWLELNQKPAGGSFR